MSKKYKIDIGCGDKKKDGCLGIDIQKFPDVDIIMDVRNDKIPLPDSSVEYVFSSHFLEHTKNTRNLFKEIGRVCMHGAELEIWTPYAFQNTAFDISHENYLTEDIWKQYCINGRDDFSKYLAGDVRWQYKQINFIVPKCVESDILKNGHSVDFALKYYRNVTEEFGVFFEISKNMDEIATIPKIVYSDTRYAKQTELKEFTRRFASDIPFKIKFLNRLQENKNMINGNQVRVFGTGSYSKKVYELLSKRNINIAGYFDNNSEVAGSYKNELPISKPEYIKNTQIIIASRYQEDIYNQLIELGYSEKDII